MANQLRVLHTSDWHLGKRIKGMRREDEFKNILNQVYQHILQSKPHLLLIAGDIFDSTLPPVWAQELYYNFLVRLKELDQRLQVIITAGNHDSPALIDAPKQLLSAFNVKVIAGTDISQENHLIPIFDEDQELIAIILAVPYLRDTHFSKVRDDSRLLSWQEELHQGMRDHYQTLISQADELRGGRAIPIIAMGHLFMQGGMINEQDGTRPAVGTLGAFVADDLFDSLDYVALGHLHQAQIIAGKENWRYSGSLLKSAFSEKLDKSVTLITFDQENKHREIRLLPLEFPIPFLSLAGSFEEQERKVLELMKKNDPVYIELNVERDALMRANILHTTLQSQGSKVKIIQITRTDKPQLLQLELSTAKELISLHQLNSLDIFKKRLEMEESLDGQEQEALITLFQHIEQALLESDVKES